MDTKEAITLKSLYDFKHIDFKIDSVGYDASKLGTYEVKERNSCELIYKLSGTADEFFSDRTLTLSPDSVMFIPETVERNLFTVKEEGLIVNIRFRLLGDLAGTNFEPEIIHLAPGNRYKNQFISAYDEWEKKDAGSYMRTHAIVSRILADLISERSQQYMQSGKYALIEPAMEHIREHFREDITVTALAKLCGISDEYLRVLMRRFTGMPPLAYINNLRLEYAYELLQSGVDTVAEAAAMSGFENVGYFSRLFKKRYHLTPSRVAHTRVTLPTIYSQEKKS